MSDALHQWQIAVCETNGLAKYPIAFATGGNKTHSYLITGDDAAHYGLKPGTYSMEPGGLTWRPYDYWGAENPTSQFDTSHAETRSKLGAFIVAHEHVRYDFVGDVVVGIDDLTPAFLDPAFHLIEHVEDALSWAWFCSAFTDAAFTAAGFVVIPGRKFAHGVTPMDQYREFVRRGWEHQ